MHPGCSQGAVSLVGPIQSLSTFGVPPLEHSRVRTLNPRPQVLAVEHTPQSDHGFHSEKKCMFNPGTFTGKPESPVLWFRSCMFIV